jgi:hypothetical protein
MSLPNLIQQLRSFTVTGEFMCDTKINLESERQQFSGATFRPLSS